jgi:hypothetical protein
MKICIIPIHSKRNKTTMQNVQNLNYLYYISGLKNERKIKIGCHLCCCELDYLIAAACCVAKIASFCFLNRYS